MKKQKNTNNKIKRHQKTKVLAQSQNKKYPIKKSKFLLKVQIVAGNFFIFSLLSALFLVSLLTNFLPKNNFEKIREQTIKEPNNYRNHLFLAQEFINTNQLDLVKTELLIAQNLSNKENGGQKVLGVNSWLEELQSEYRESNPEEIKKEIMTWTKIAAENPQYRDSLLRLAYYYYKLNDIPVAKENLEKALILDPNFFPSQELRRLIK